MQLTPIGSRHAACVDRLTDVFSERCRAIAIVHVQNPLVLSEGTEFYPEVVLLRRRPDFYNNALPRPQAMYGTRDAWDRMRELVVERLQEFAS